MLQLFLTIHTHTLCRLNASKGKTNQSLRVVGRFLPLWYCLQKRLGSCVPFYADYASFIRFTLLPLYLNSENLGAVHNSRSSRNMHEFRCLRNLKNWETWPLPDLHTRRPAKSSRRFHAWWPLAYPANIRRQLSSGEVIRFVKGWDISLFKFHLPWNTFSSARQKLAVFASELEPGRVQYSGPPVVWHFPICTCWFDKVKIKSYQL